jgi:hypothetical protein
LRDKLRVIPSLQGDAGLCRRIWNGLDAFAHTYIRRLVLSF